MWLYCEAKLASGTHLCFRLNSKTRASETHFAVEASLSPAMFPCLAKSFENMSTGSKTVQSYLAYTLKRNFFALQRKLYHLSERFDCFLCEGRIFCCLAARKLKPQPPYSHFAKLPLHTILRSQPTETTLLATRDRENFVFMHFGFTLTTGCFRGRYGGYKLVTSQNSNYTKLVECNSLVFLDPSDRIKIKYRPTFFLFHLQQLHFWM